jgi:hypothetical protein
LESMFLMRQQTTFSKLIFLYTARADWLPKEMMRTWAMLRLRNFLLNCVNPKFQMVGMESLSRSGQLFPIFIWTNEIAPHQHALCFQR